MGVNPPGGAAEEGPPGTPRPPARLFAILAREAPVGVIFRRGPTEWTRLIRWDTANDTFEPGHWFRGSIYTGESDLSPDGKLLVYHAAKWGKWSAYYEALQAGDLKGQRESMEHWTAISKPPWLTALALWPPYLTYGGGFFASNRQVVLYLPHEGLRPFPDKRPRGVKVSSDDDWKGDPSLFTCGWTVTYYWQYDKPKVWRTPHVREKPRPGGGPTLVHTIDYRSKAKWPDRYELRKGDGSLEELPGADWANWDKAGRLVYAAAGKLWARDAVKRRLQPPRELADFNAMEPEAIPPPDWAKSW